MCQVIAAVMASDGIQRHIAVVKLPALAEFSFGLSGIPDNLINDISLPEIPDPFLHSTGPASDSIGVQVIRNRFGGTDPRI